MAVDGTGRGLALALALFATSIAARESAPAVRLLDLDGKHVELASSPGVTTVFVFARTDCPISNRYAPELRRLYEKFAPRGVVFWLVYPDPDESAAAIREHLAAYAYPMAALRDPEHALVRATQATVTPEAVVISASGQQIYRGRIDDRFVDFGQTRAEPTTRDLESAVEAALAGELPTMRNTRAVGCFIPALR